MTTYNLLDEPWLPVRWRGGRYAGTAPPSAVGLREALIRAHDIAELATDNPLETISLNRLLAALVASALPELANETDWFKAWDAGQFDANRVDDYLRQYSTHFDLLSPVRPFFGHPQTDAKEISPLSRLQHAATSGNNALLFSHDLDSVSQTMTFAEVARALVASQAFAVSGGAAKPFYYSHGPLISKAIFWIRGRKDTDFCLFRTLLLNLSPTEKVWGNPRHGQGLATWVADTAPAPLQNRQVAGISDLFTFQSRRFQLVVSDLSIVTGVRCNQGSTMNLLFHDPYLAYRKTDNGPTPLRLSLSRALWRDSIIYMMSSSSNDHPPRTFEWLSDPSTLVELDLTTDTPFLVDVFGLINDDTQAGKIHMWRQERVTIYPSIINEVGRWNALQEMLDTPNPHINDAKKMALKLREAVRAFANRSRLNKPYESNKNGKVERTRLQRAEQSDRDAFVQMIDAESRYWLALGSVFDTFLGQVATLSVEGEELQNLQHRWQTTLRQTAQKALRQALESFQQDARTLQAQAEAELVLRLGTLYPKSDKSNKPETV
ncbi:type I-E CRISPR-associated protein Cse1/CasA [Spirosoma sp. SC4-14]|uniref:type I-E CRISPR-associated protein Cse1/CasA n=1 Tax=Spirosoma sp. SC4-14 TaxID=3128900 RepID=UPI0030D45318